MAYAYRGTITIDHAKCGTADSSDFLFVWSITDVKLKSVANGGVIQNSATVEGVTVPTDLVFSSDAGGASLYSWKIESWDPTSGTIVAKIRVPISHTTDLAVHVNAGDSGVTTFRGGSKGAAYNSNYCASYDFNGSGPRIADSTANGNDFTASNALTAATGQVDGGLSANGSTTRISGTGFSPKPTTQLSILAWVKTSSAQGVIFELNRDSGTITDEFLYRFNGSANPSFLDFDTGIEFNATANSSVNDGSWHMVGVVRNGTSLTFYKDGASDGTATAGASVNYSGGNGAFNSVYDKRDFDNSGSGLANCLNGSIDQLDIFNTALTSSWVTAAYNNQNAPTSFSSWSGLSITHTSQVTADAVLKKTLFGTLSADADLRKNGITHTLSVDATLRKTQSGSFTADANLAARAAKTFTADAVLKKTVSGSITADADLRKVVTGSFTANADLKATAFALLTADAVLRKIVSGALTADADLRKTGVTGSFTADASLLHRVTGTFTADADLKKTVGAIFTADADLRRAGVAFSFTVDAVLLKRRTGSFTADADLEKTVSQAITADADLKKTVSLTFIADADLRKSGIAGAFTCNAVFRKTQSGSFTANALLRKTITSSFTASACLRRDGVTHSFTADANIAPFGTIAVKTYTFAFTVDALLVSTNSRWKPKISGHLWRERSNVGFPIPSGEDRFFKI